MQALLSKSGMGLQDFGPNFQHVLTLCLLFSAQDIDPYFAQALQQKLPLAVLAVALHGDGGTVQWQRPKDLTRGILLVCLSQNSKGNELNQFVQPNKTNHTTFAKYSALGINKHKMSCLP